MDVSTLPFNKHLGLSVGSHEGRPAVLLTPAAHHLNHVGTVHAAVLFGIAEAASGQWLLRRFAELTATHVAVLRESSAKYRRPAVADAELLAWGTASEEAAASFYERLLSRGRASLDIQVSVTQRNLELFAGTFGWFAAAKGA